MSVFEVSEENGMFRALKSKDGFQTPYLLRTQEESRLRQIIVSERGMINLDKINLDNLEHHDYEESIPEWSIITPRLVINFEKLEDTQKQEEDLFLSRLGNLKLPSAFGLVYDPENSDGTYLSKLLSLKPSIIAIRMQNIESKPSRKVLDLILKTRNEVPKNTAIYLPGGVPVGFFALFLSMGIDIFDDNSVYRLASSKRSFEDGFVQKSSDDLKQIIELNKNELERDFYSVIKHIQNNTVWTRIARDMHSHPMVASLVTLLGHQALERGFINNFSSHKTNPINFTGEESFFHPDVLNYHRKLLSNYKIPEHKKILVLLPCSAKKPYQESRTHKEFMKAIKYVSRKQLNEIEIWSLTSPIAVVPRELERVYPAMYYDLPVTGNWSYEESKKCGLILRKMLENVEIPIIAHVSHGYKQMVEIGLKNKSNVSTWIGEKPAGWESLTNLKNNLSKAMENLEENEIPRLKNSHINSINEISALIRYHHGINSEVSLEDIKFQGRPPRPVQVQRNNKYLLSWDVFKGKVNLSMDAAIDIAKTSSKWILTDTQELKGSSLFAVGVHSASQEISPDDEVLIFNKDKTYLLGIGVAIVSGQTMTQLDYGIVANLKKKGVMSIESK